MKFSNSQRLFLVVSFGMAVICSMLAVTTA
jgi:hypothetical protein